MVIYYILRYYKMVTSIFTYLNIKKFNIFTFKNKVYLYIVFIKKWFKKHFLTFAVRQPIGNMLKSPYIYKV